MLETELVSRFQSSSERNKEIQDMLNFFETTIPKHVKGNQTNLIHMKGNQTNSISRRALSQMNYKENRLSLTLHPRNQLILRMMKKIESPENDEDTHNLIANSNIDTLYILFLEPWCQP